MNSIEQNSFEVYKDEEAEQIGILNNKNIRVDLLNNDSPSMRKNECQ